MTDKGEFEGLYERLSDFKSLEGREVEEWLKDLKRGDSVEVTETEKDMIKEIHEEETANEVSSRTMKPVDREEVEYERDKSVVDTSTGEIETEKVKQIFERNDGRRQVIYETEDGDTEFGGVID